MALRQRDELLGELVVEAEQEGRVVDLVAGLERIQPQDIERVPGPDVAGDLASYLTTLPGVVIVGDQGGQFYVRGGEPTQNLVLLDGMLVYQPFHILSDCTKKAYWEQFAGRLGVGGRLVAAVRGVR